MSAQLRADLDKHFCISYGNIKHESHAKDDTQKFVVTGESADQAYECVFIPEEDRGTMCVSSQVGCSLSCRFCATGTQKFEKNLTTAEIVGQLMTARYKKQLNVTNVVYMGQGEPLYNFKNVSNAVAIMADEHGLAISKRKIIVSTSGVVPAIHKVAETGAQLAISLHATTNQVRDYLVPINKTFPLEMLLDACRTYPNLRASRNITFEYVMLKNVNDFDDDAKRLVELLHDIPSTVNLIPFNKWPGSEFECSDNQRIIDFSSYCYSHGIRAPIRWPRGRDIDAACGMLQSNLMNRKKQFVERNNTELHQFMSQPASSKHLKTN